MLSLAPSQPVTEESTVRVPCSVFSRIVGYLSDVYGTWHAGKQAEWRDRVPFQVPAGVEEDV